MKNPQNIILNLPFYQIAAGGGGGGGGGGGDLDPKITSNEKCADEYSSVLF